MDDRDAPITRYGMDTRQTEGRCVRLVVLLLSTHINGGCVAGSGVAAAAVTATAVATTRCTAWFGRPGVLTDWTDHFAGALENANLAGLGSVVDTGVAAVAANAVTCIARAAALLLAKREAAFSGLPRKDDARNADHFRFNFEALLFDVDHFCIHSAGITACFAFCAASLIQAACGNRSRIEQSTDRGDNECRQEHSQNSFS